MPEKKWRTSKWEEEGLLKCGGENAYSFRGNDEVIKLVGSAQETVEDLIRKVIGLNADSPVNLIAVTMKSQSNFLSRGSL